MTMSEIEECCWTGEIRWFLDLRPNPHGTRAHKICAQILWSCKLACSVNTPIHSRFHLLAFAPVRPVWIGPACACGLQNESCPLDSARPLIFGACPVSGLGALWPWLFSESGKFKQKWSNRSVLGTKPDKGILRVNLAVVGQGPPEFWICLRNGCGDKTEKIEDVFNTVANFLWWNEVAQKFTISEMGLMLKFPFRWELLPSKHCRRWFMWIRRRGWWNCREWAVAPARMWMISTLMLTSLQPGGRFLSGQLKQGSKILMKPPPLR